jgi:Carboxypeptidase regulatory-like domain
MRPFAACSTQRHCRTRYHQRIRVRLYPTIILAVVLSLTCSVACAQTSTVRLDVSTADSSGRPVIGALVEVFDAEHMMVSGQTDEFGHVLFSRLPQGRYDVAAHANGYATAEQKNVNVSENLAGLELKMLPLLSQRDVVEVHGTVAEVETNAAIPNTLPASTARELPGRPSTVSDALPLIPGVFREPGGGLILSSSPENRSALIVNSADVTDPATGQFGTTIPIDSVEVLNVFQTAYMAEYGRFTAGLVSVETKRGSDKWNWDLSDPLPEFRIRSYHLRGLKTATPRASFQGPLIKEKLFFSEGLEYDYRKIPVYTQPFPYNQKRQQGWNSFSQFDWVQSTRHLLTATAHLAPQTYDSPNLDAFNPLAATPSTSSHNYTGTIIDHLTLWRGLLETRFSVTQFNGATWGQGPADFVMSPSGNSGNYFANQYRDASRLSGAMTYSLSPIQKFGSHQIKAGAYFASSETSGSIAEHPIDIVSATGALLERITFRAPQTFDVEDVERSYFAQDHWILTPRLAVDVGVRTEAQQISGTLRVAPRFGFSWMLPGTTHTTLRGGYGLFYDRVPLNVYAFNRYPEREITDYSANGTILGPPTIYFNTLGQSRVRRPFVSQQPVDGNFSPESRILSVQLEQPVTKLVKLRATYLDNYSNGLVIMSQTAPANYSAAYLLEGSGTSRYRQFDVTAQINLRPDRLFFFSYVRSDAAGDLNEFSQYLGSLTTPVIRPNFYGTLGTNIPNRILMWGVAKLPQKFQIAPTIEYRNGLPYSNLTANQQYLGEPNSNRFPSFISLDARVSRDFQVTPKYAVRLSVTGFNLMNHLNPEAVHNNSADPAYGYFFGHRGRRFTLDFDFIF